MELERIIEILEKHQEWRRDKNVPPKTEMQSPIEIGTAIDYALIELKKLRLGVSQQREQFYNFITWYNAKPFIKKPKDGLITTTIIEEYLKL